MIADLAELAVSATASKARPQIVRSKNSQTARNSTNVAPRR